MQFAWYHTIIFEFDGGPWQKTTTSPTSKIKNAMPPWLMDIMVTSDADPEGVYTSSRKLDGESAERIRSLGAAVAVYYYFFINQT